MKMFSENEKPALNLQQPEKDPRWNIAARYVGWFVAALAMFTCLEAIAYGVAGSFMSNYEPFSYLVPHGLALLVFYRYAGPRAVMSMAFLASLMAISGTLASDMRGVVSAGIAIAALFCWCRMR